MIRKIEEISQIVCSENNVSLYDIEIKHTQKGEVYIIYINKIGGVTISDCATISRKIGNILEEEDIINDRYYLEVSSCGIERKLNFKKHYMGAINEKVKITYGDAPGEKKTIIGILKEVLLDKIIVEIEEEIIEIPFNEIKKARTYFEFKKEKE